MKSLLRSRVPLLGVALAFAFISGCDEQPAGVDSSDGLEARLARLGPGIHPVVLATQSDGVLDIELQLRRVGVEDPISGYQGELVFDPAKLSLESVTLPDSVTGDWSQPDAGRIRLAALRASGMRDDAGLRLRFHSTATTDSSSFDVHVEEIVSASGFQDITAQLVERAHPLFARANRSR